MLQSSSKEKVQNTPVDIPKIYWSILNFFIIPIAEVLLRNIVLNILEINERFLYRIFILLPDGHPVCDIRERFGSSNLILIKLSYLIILFVS